VRGAPPAAATAGSRSAAPPGRSRPWIRKTSISSSSLLLALRSVGPSAPSGSLVCAPGLGWVRYYGSLVCAPGLGSGVACGFGAADPLGFSGGLIDEAAVPVRAWGWFREPDGSGFL
jgi:hypothetical protein